MKKWLVSAALAAGLTLGGCGKTATTEEGGKVRVGVQAVIAGATGITYDLLIEQPSAAGAYEAVVTQAVATTNAPGGDATFVASCIPYAEAARNKVRVTVTLKTVTMANNVASPAPLPQTKTVDAGNCLANADIQAPLTFQLNSGGTGERGFVDTLVTIESTPVNVTAKIDCQQSLLPNPSGTAGAARVPGVVFGLANNASQNLALFLDNPYNKQIYSGTDSAATPFKFLNAAMYLNDALAGPLSGDGLWLPNAAFFQNGLGYVHYAALTAANGADSCGSTETAPLQYTVAVGGGTITGTSQTVYIVENVDTSNFRVRSSVNAALNTAANAALAVKPTAGTATDACWVSKESATFQVLATVDSVLKVFACTAADGCGYSVAYSTLANQFKDATTGTDLNKCLNTVAAPVANYTLAVLAAHYGGDVTVAPTPLSFTCTNWDINCDYVYAPGTVVTLTRTPMGGFHYADWPGCVLDAGSPNLCTLTMDASKTVNLQPWPGSPPAPAQQVVVVNGLNWAQETSPTSNNWTNAGIYCANLTAGGMTGFRLPTINELYFLYISASYAAPPFLAANLTEIVWTSERVFPGSYYGYRQSEALFAQNAAITDSHPGLTNEEYSLDYMRNQGYRDASTGFFVRCVHN